MQACQINIPCVYVWNVEYDTHTNRVLESHTGNPVLNAPTTTWSQIKEYHFGFLAETYLLLSQTYGVFCNFTFDFVREFQFGLTPKQNVWYINAAEMPVKLQGNTIILTPNLADSGLHEIWWQDVVPLSD